MERAARAAEGTKDLTEAKGNDLNEARTGMRRFHEIARYSGFAPEIGRRLAQLESLRLKTIALFSELSPEQIASRPPGVANSIGTLVVHIAETEAFWIVERIGGRPLPASRREIYRMDLFGTPGSPQAPRAPAAYLIGILADLRADTRSLLARMSDADILGKRVWVDPEDAQEQDVFTVEWILNHVGVHEAHHQGQIAMIRRMAGF
jgi:uncharacterized damage-inducible protein DinB